MASSPVPLPPKLYGDDKNYNRFMDLILAYLSSVSDCRILFGQPVQGIVIAAGATAQFPHLLNRIPTGWIVTKAIGTTYDLNQTASSSSQLSIRNSGAASVTADFWVF